MNRYLFLLISTVSILLLSVTFPSFTGLGLVNAQTAPQVTAEDESNDAPGACDQPALPGDPPCHIPRDIADDPVIQSKSTEPCQEVTDDYGNTTVECDATVTHSWPLFYVAGAAYEVLKGKWIADGITDANKKLNPQTIQDMTTNRTNMQYESHATRRCIYDNDGNLVKNEVSEYIIKMPIEWINRFSQNADSVSQKYSLRKRNDQYYEVPSEIIKKSTAHECSYRIGAVDMSTSVNETTGKIEFDIFRLVMEVINAWLGTIFNSKQVVLASKRLAKAEQMLCYGSHCSAQDLEESPLSDEQKNYYQRTPGFVETKRPGSIAYRQGEINGLRTNPFVGTVPPTNETKSFQTKAIEDTYGYWCSTVWPAAMQPPECRKTVYVVRDEIGIPPEGIVSDVDNPPGPSCKDGIDEPGFERKPGDLEASITAATAGKIPRCVLAGVAEIEGAAAEIASGKCSPNQCSATGPFQITIGFTYSGSGASCNKDTTCAACGKTSCPNALPMLPAGVNPCDTASAANAAVSLLIGKASYFGRTLDMSGNMDAIITAGDSYYGAPVPISRFGGCSYGEWIYKNACGNASYECRPHELRQTGPSS